MENKKETKLNLKQLEKITGGFYRVIFSDGGYTIALRATENETITSKFSFKELIFIL